MVLAGGIKAWCVTSFEACRAAFSDNESFSKDLENTWEAFRNGHVPLTGDVVIGLGDSMLVSDPPRHTRLRTLVNRAFTARRVASMRTEIAAATAELVNDLRDHDPGIVNLVTDYAARLPMRVICDMLDIPRAEGERLRACVEAVMSSDEGSQERAMASFREVHEYLVSCVAD